MLLLGLEVPIFLVLLLHDYSISRFLDHKALKIKQKDYEDYFLKRYGIGKTYSKKNYIPLSFGQRHTQNLLNLCTKYSHNKWLPQYHLNKRRVQNYEPKIEVQYLGFRMQSENPRPVLVQMIRCIEEYALIAAENGWSGFVLKRDPNPDEKQRWGIPSATLFYLYTKFRYGKNTSPESSSVNNKNQASTLSGKTRCQKSSLGRLLKAGGRGERFDKLTRVKT